MSQIDLRPDDVLYRLADSAAEFLHSPESSEARYRLARALELYNDWRTAVGPVGDRSPFVPDPFSDDWNRGARDHP